MVETTTVYYGSFINGNELKGNGRKELEVYNPYNNEVIGVIACANKEDVDDAVRNAHDVFEKTMRRMPAYQRSDILRKTADLLEEKFEDFAKMLTLEAGKPFRESRGEVTRALQVLRLASEGAKSIYGEQIPLDTAIGGENRIGFTKRVPLGVIAGITPFNFPLNLALHKIAPAIAAGNTIVLKPAEKTPLTSVMLYKLFEEAGLPNGALNILMGPGVDLVEPLVTHPLVEKVTFTGSDAVGWKIKEMASRKKVTLELGANAPNIIFADANLEEAIEAIASGGYSYAGQACISAQRIYVEQPVHDEFVRGLVEKVKGLKTGDPRQETTEFGPMITEEAAKRAESWIDEAKESGATIATGGKREGSLLEPTVITNVKPHMNVVCAEVFAPIVSVIPFESEEEAVRQANDSHFSIHAGVFTKDINRAMRLTDTLDITGIWINEVSVRRYDHIPYGGKKSSGIGKEGVKYAIEEMTDIRFVGIKLS